MSGMSFAEMAAVYTSTTKAPLPLTETVLSGKTTLEKLDKLYYVRQYVNHSLPFPLNLLVINFFSLSRPLLYSNY